MLSFTDHAAYESKTAPLLNWEAVRFLFADYRNRYRLGRDCKHVGLGDAVNQVDQRGHRDRLVHKVINTVSISELLVLWAGSHRDDARVLEPTIRFEKTYQTQAIAIGQLHIEQGNIWHKSAQDSKGFSAGGCLGYTISIGGKKLAVQAA